MNAFLLTTKDESILDFIVNNLIDAPEKNLSKKHLRTLLSDDRTSIFAVVLNAEVIGYALIYTFPSLYESKHLAYLYDIEVLERQRRKGAGKLLIEMVLKKLRESHVSELWLGTGIENTNGQAFFSSTGAVRSGEIFQEFTYVLAQH